MEFNSSKIINDVSNPPPFAEFEASMMTFVAGYDGALDLKQIFPLIDIDSKYDGVYDTMPVGEDGTIVSKGFGDVRVGAIRRGRSTKCFRNIISIDISVLGVNVNIKVTGTNYLQGSGAKSPAHADYAAKLLIWNLNLLGSDVTLTETHIVNATYNMNIKTQLNMNATATLLANYNGMHVVYNNAINQPIVAVKNASNAEEILSRRSTRSKKGKIPSVKLTIRTSGKIMLSGANIDDLEDIYVNFMQWLSINLPKVKISHTI